MKSANRKNNMFNSSGRTEYTNTSKKGILKKNMTAGNIKINQKFQSQSKINSIADYKMKLGTPIRVHFRDEDLCKIITEERLKSANKDKVSFLIKNLLQSSPHSSIISQEFIDKNFDESEMSTLLSQFVSNFLNNSNKNWELSVESYTENLANVHEEYSKYKNAAKEEIKNKFKSELEFLEKDMNISNSINNYNNR